MLRRWNLTILIILLALVIGIALGYTYRDRYSWLLSNRDQLERTEPDTSQEIFRTEISDLLAPQTGLEAASGLSEVYAFTGRLYGLRGDQLTVEQPTDATATLDAIDFILTDTTRFETLQVTTNAFGLPDTITTPITVSDLQLDDIVTVYTVEDIKTSTEHHVMVVQKLVGPTE